MKNIKYIIGLLVLIAVSCSKPLTDEQKNADSILLKQIHEYTLNADGSMDYRYYHQRQFNSYMSFHRLYGETFVIYNPKFQSLTVSKSETTMADGKKVQSPENAFNEVLPFQAADAPAYNHLREMVITHVGLEIGAVVELDYTLHSDAGFTPFFAEKQLLNESSPIKELEVTVKVPKGESLNYFFVNQNDNIRFNKSTKGNFDIYTWKANDLRARSNEPNQVEGYADYQTLLFSNLDLANSVRILKDALTKDFSLDKSMESLLKRKSKDWDLVEEIRAYVAKNMNSYWVSPRYAGYQFRNPNEVWASNGGTEAEKAMLLASLLTKAGFEANLALAAYPQYLSPEVGCPMVFDKYLVKVDINGETKFIKAIDDRSEVPGARAMLSVADDISSIEFKPVEKPDIRAHLQAQLNFEKDESVLCEGTISFSNYNKDKGLLTDVPSAMLSTTNKPDDGGQKVIAFEFAKVKAQTIDNYISYSFPRIAQGIAMANLRELPTDRVTRLELPGAIDELYEYVVKIPKGFELVSPEYNEVLENEFGRVSITFEWANGELKVSRHLVLKNGIVPVEAYPQFRELIGLWMDSNLNRVLIKQI
jgi:hypothetical protein